MDAEILQEVFWASLQVIERGEDYSVPPDWVYSAYSFYAEEFAGALSAQRAVQLTAAAKLKAKADRDKKARMRQNYVWLQIQVPAAIEPGTICRVADEDTRVHFVRVPSRENMLRMSVLSSNPHHKS